MLLSDRKSMPPTLKASLVPGELTQRLLDGAIEPQGFTWHLNVAASVDANSRQMLDGAFDVAEMSFATFLKAREQGRDLIGLPVFTGRGFLQPAVLCRDSSPVQGPDGLRGRRVGIPQFWQTSSVWHRGTLQHQYGVSPDEITWYTTTDERFDGLSMPAGLEVRRLPAGQTIHEALSTGAIDAVMVPPRGAVRAVGNGVRTVFADAMEATRTYYCATGVFPIMHFVVMRESLSLELPFLAPALFSMFRSAKGSGGAAEPADHASDPERWAYGLQRNQPTLQTFLRFCRDQSWLTGSTSVRDVFVAGAEEMDD